MAELENQSHVNTFFIEHDECFELISKLCSRSTILPSAEGDGNAGFTFSSSIKKKCQSLQQFRAIFDKYLECPTLLDPYLEALVTQLATSARNIVHDYFTLCTRSITETTDDTTSKQQQHLCCNVLFPLSALQSMCKVRGRKKIQKFLPHQVDDLEPVLFSIRNLQDPHFFLSNNESNKLEELNINADDDNFPAFWESTFVLFTWLEVLSLLPFNLSTLDSSIVQHKVGKDDKIEESTLMGSITQICKMHLVDTGPTREAAASCLARLLTRPDLEKEDALENFVVNYAAGILKRWENYNNSKKLPSHPQTQTERPFEEDDTEQTEHKLLFLVLGVIETLVHVFKAGARTNLINLVSCMETIWEHCILLAENESRSNGSSCKQQPMVLRKLLVKLFARVGCAHLKPHVAEWRYDRGNRSLLENLSRAQTNTSDKNSIASSDEKSSPDQSTPTTPSTQDESTEDEPTEDVDPSYFFIIPLQIEDVTCLLLHYLRDPATNIRYTAAKNLGRITERLPLICSQDILDAILHFFDYYDDSDSTSWHGACLALAELARRGLLLPNRLEESVKAVLRAMDFDKRKNSMMVIGSQVRDAACYACWAFARAYSPAILSKYIRPLTEGMLRTALFDRELNCRRAASAAFQEFVGRMGGQNVELGIEILTRADYFALGKKEDAFRKVAVDIAGMAGPGCGYRRVIVNTLKEKVFHWDVEIRILASKALGDICSLEVHYMHKVLLGNLVKLCTDPDFNIRHGAVLAVAEITASLKGEILESDDKPDQSSLLLLDIAELVAKIEKERLYRGKGGEIMREAAARLIECISTAKIKLSVKQQVRLLDSIDTHLKHPKDKVQEGGAKALHALTRSYFPVGINGPSERLQQRVVDKYIELVRTTENVAVARGFTMALGVLPKKLLAPNKKVLNEVIDCLCDAAKADSKVGQDPDAETRRNAIVSLSKIVQTVGIENEYTNSSEKQPMVSLDIGHISKIFELLFSSMEDYNMDRRGDVGSWSRIAAMTALEELTYSSVKASYCIPQFSTSSHIASSKDSGDLLVPSVGSRFSFLVANAEIQVISSLKTQTMLPMHRYLPLNDVMYFDSILCQRILQAFLKQLSEKLDAVRLHAGFCLERLLLSKQPQIPFVPHRSILLEALTLDPNASKSNKQENISWANPAVTFPLVMRAANIPFMFEAIISGMVISVGGLTESVVKNSKAALFEWIRAVKKSKSQGKTEIGKLGDVFISLFARHSRDGRVIVPLLKTLEQLLSQGYLDSLLSKNSAFPVKLHTKLKIETNMCTDVQRIFAAVGVLVGLLSAEDAKLVREEVFPYILKLLNHRYPRVRVYTAEQLYIKLLEDDGTISELCPNFDDAVSLLLEAVWGGENVREERNKVADSLGIKLSPKVRDGTMNEKSGKSARKRPKDEFASYMSLVKDSGR